MTKTQVKNDKIKRQIYAGSQSFGIFGKKAIIQNLKVTKKIIIKSCKQPNNLNIMKLNFDINKFNYQLVKTIDNSTVTNYYLYTKIKYNLNELKELALSFKEKYSYKNCNIYFINNIEILEVLEKYPKSDSESVKFAESIIADFPFDCNDEIFSYPFKDWKYEELITK